VQFVNNRNVRQVRRSAFAATLATKSDHNRIQHQPILADLLMAQSPGAKFPGGTPSFGRAEFSGGASENHLGSQCTSRHALVVASQRAAR
jgi:hypothetical protein